jgi:DNA modification methylase
MEYKKISEIKLLENNPRTISDRQFKILCTSIKKNIDYFEARPLILSDRTGELVVIAGNQRYKAAESLGLKEVPTYLMKNLTEDTEREIVIRDNISNGDWDFDLLANEWNTEELEDWGLDGFPFEEATELEAEEDDYTEPDNIQVDVVLGDLIEIGEHRLLCGDSTCSDQVAKLMNGEKADMVFTDPPYGISIVDSKTNKVGAENLAKNQEYSAVIGDDTTDTAKDFYNTCISLNMENFIIWGGNYFTDFLPFSKSWIIWDKRGDMNSNNFADGEMAWCSFHSRVRIYKQIWNGMIREGESGQRVHPTQKPVKMLGEIIEDHIKGDLIFDGFLGSGSTMVASHQLKRKCYGMELDPKYCQVIIDRMSKLDPSLEVKINGVVYNKQENEPTKSNIKKGYDRGFREVTRNSYLSL